MEYNFGEIEQKWQDKWNESQAYKVSNTSDKPKYYVLDMFPYPSGAGLHVGHPLGYIASDIFSRYKRLKGFNVLHPMGYDAFGLPAEQYAIEHGVHPAVSTEQNIANFRKQLDKIGFCYDWDREVLTCDPKYYKWTQWIFLQLFNSYFNPLTQKATPITKLVKAFESEGSIQIDGLRTTVKPFSAEEWKAFTEKEQQDILMEFRLAFCGYGEVNWCEALGTVLANDEVVNGVSERGGHPVEKKRLRQWYLRITDYADRLLNDLQKLEWSDAMKEMQTNWIGKSTGAEISFKIQVTGSKNDPTNVERTTYNVPLIVYTTRPDTIFGVDFMVVSPEHELVAGITSAVQQKEVEDYITYVKSRSERERQSEKKITGAFTGAFAINPFDGREIPIWISEYVLAGYGTGAIMAVPCGDERDFKFANHFNIPITNIIGDAFNGTEPNATKDAKLTNSGFLNGVVLRDAIQIVVDKLEEMGIGKRKINYRMRDAAFSRQRYWGEPFPIVWKNGIAYPLPETELPLELPKVESYSPGPDGEGPLANIPEWFNQYADAFIPLGEGGVGTLETNTMPGYAGSSWYFLRYMDNNNDTEFASRQATDYWNQVDLYIGGTEHAVGHLLYSRLWTKVLYDLGHLGFDEPFKKLLNQGMITGSSAFLHMIGFNISRLINISSPHIHTDDELKKISDLNAKYQIIQNTYLSFEASEILKRSYPIQDTQEKIDQDQIKNNILNILLAPINLNIENEGLLGKVSIDHSFYHHYKTRIPIEYVNNDNEVDYEKLENENQKFSNSTFITLDGKTVICSREVEKMSKSKFNVVNPNDIIEKFGADTFRMYEMFLGPIEQSKPWDTKGIEGVHRFLKKLWRLFYDEHKGKVWNEAEPNADELKILHRTIKKIEDDTERFSFNTAVSAFMVCVNDLADIKCHKRAILEPILILLTPYAPHIAEELWHSLGNESLIIDAAFPKFEAKYVVESSKEYPVSINGKVRTNLNLPLDMAQAEVEAAVTANETIQKWLEGKAPKKIIFVKGRMINVVI